MINRLVEIYPAKNRFYYTGRWEAWNKLPSTPVQPKNYLKIKMIRGTQSIPQQPDDISPKLAWNLQSSTYRGLQTLVRVPIAKEISFTAHRKSKNTEIKKKESMKPVEVIDPEIYNCEKYSYSVCVGNMNIRGRQISQDNTKRSASPGHPTSSQVHRALRRKEKHRYFRFPAVSVPSPWQVITKSIEDTSAVFIKNPQAEINH